MEKMTLANMCNGGVQERIDRALSKISDNILDINTDAKKKRTLTVQIVFMPSEEDRENVAVEVHTSTKLAPETGLKTQFYISKDLDSNTVNIAEYLKGTIRGQLTLDDCGMVVKDEVTAEELGCDPETGEVIENKVISMRQAR
jgi:topoisomerase IA-like protein